MTYYSSNRRKENSRKYGLQASLRARLPRLEALEAKCLLAVVVDVDDVNPTEVAFSGADGVPDVLILSVNEDGLLQFATSPADPPNTLLDDTMLRVTDVPGVMNPPDLVTRLSIELGAEDEVVFAQGDLPFLFSSPAIHVLVDAGTVVIDTTHVAAETPGDQVLRFGDVGAPDETKLLISSETVVGANQVILAGALDANQVGDLDLNGQVDGDDLLDWLLDRRDVDGDGMVNVQDAIAIIRSLGDVRSLTVEAQQQIELHASVGMNETVPLRSLALAAPQTVVHNVGRISTVGDQTYETAILLAADTEFHSSGGDISFRGVIDAVDDAVEMTSVAGLTASAPLGGVLFEDSVGGDSQDGLTVGLDSDQDGLRHLTIAAVAASRGIEIMAPAIVAVEDQAYNGPVRLLGDVALMSLGSVTFADVLDGAFQIAITASETHFAGAVGEVQPLAMLQLNGLSGGNTIFIGGPIDTAGDQIYNDAVVLTADAALSSAAGSVTFEDMVDSDAMGPFSLAVAVPAGAATFRGRAGTGDPPLLPLNDLTVNGETVLDVASPDLPSVATVGDQVYNGPVELAQNVTLQSDSGDVTFAGVVRSAADGQQGLTVNTSGITEFQAIVGPAGLRLSELATGPGPSPQAGDPDVTRIGGGEISTTGDQTYQDDVVLTSNAVLRSDASILFGGTVNGDGAAAGPWDLTLDAASIRLGGSVGDDQPLDDLVVNGALQVAGSAIRTEGLQTYNGAVTLEAHLVQTSLGGGNVTFGSTLDGPFSLEVDTGGATTFAGAASGLASLATLGGGPTQINADISTTGPQTYGDAVVLGAPLVTLTSTGGGDVTFQQTVTAALAESLTVNTAGATIFNGPVTGLVNLTTDGAGGDQTQINADITTAGDQTFGDAVLLGAPIVTLTSTAAGDITFQGTLSGSGTPLSSLNVNTGGTTTFDDTVSELTNLTTDGAGGDSTRINADVLTAGDQAYGDRVVLGASVTLTSTDSGDIAFLNVVNSEDGQQGLTVNTSGLTDFQGAVGAIANMALAALTTGPSPSVADPGQTQIGGGQVITTGDQTYDDRVVLTSNAVLRADASILFGATVNGDGAVAGPWDLTLQAASIRFGDSVGNDEPLDSLLVDGPVQIAGSVIQSRGSQTYNGAVILEVSTAATSDAGNITFMESVDAADDGDPAASPAGLTVDRRQGSAEIMFHGPVGGGAAGGDPQGLAFLDVRANGILRLVDTTADPDIRTLGDARIEVLQAAVNSAGDDLLVSAGVLFESTGGAVALLADDVTILSGASITAAAELTIQIDHGAPGGDPGGVFQAVGTQGVIGAGAGVFISGLGADDEAHVHAARLRAGDDHTISMLAGSDLVDLTFDDANQWAAPDTTLSTNGGDGDDVIEFHFAPDAVISTQPGTAIAINGDDGANGGVDSVLIDHSDDTTARLAQFQFVDVAAGTSVAVGGFGTATSQFTDPLAGGTFTIANAEAYKIVGPDAAGVGSHLQVRGAASAANEIGVAGFIPQVDPPATASSVQVPSYIRNRPTAVPGVPEVVPAETVNFARRFFVQGYNCLHLIGGNDSDVLVNETSFPALIEGNGGDDLLAGGSSADVIFAGGGVDTLLGFDGDDFLFADVGLAFTGSAADPMPIDSPGSPFPDPPGLDPADLLFGGPGINHAAQTGLDLVVDISGMLLDGGATKDVITWLRAQLMVFNAANVQMLINNAFFGGNGKIGLTDLGCDVSDFAIDRLPPPANAQPAAPLPLVVAETGTSSTTAAQAAETPTHVVAGFAAASNNAAPLRDGLFADLGWLQLGR